MKNPRQFNSTQWN